MSYQEYQSGLHAPSNDVIQTEPDTVESSPEPQTTQDVQHKGFKDITVIQTSGILGDSEEIRLTSEYFGPQKKKNKTKRKYDGCALLVRRTIRRSRNGDSPGPTELVIQSKPLCTTFREIVGETYDSIDIKSTPIKIPEPFFELFFKRDAIRERLRDPATNKDLRAEIKFLDDFIRNDKLTIRNQEEYDCLIGQNMIGYSTLWTLFPPNELVIRNDGAASECWLCRNVIQDPMTCSWYISGVRLDFNGQEIGLKKDSYCISFLGRVNGTMDISQLPLIPVRYFHGWEEKRKALVKRGEELQKIMGTDLDGHAYRHYKGPLWEKHNLYSPPESKINQRVVVDYKGYLDCHPERAVTLEAQDQAKKSETQVLSGASDDSDSDSGEDDAEGPSDATTLPAEDTDGPDEDAFTRLLNRVSGRYGMRNGLEDLLVLCPARIPGYGLTAKEWGWMLIDELQPISPSSNAFESLQVEGTTKSLIRSLVHGHRSGKADDFDDVIRGKGKGLVLLLDGKPGIGKTLTAGRSESIAELYGSPLYSVSGGELSVNVTRVEVELKKVFSLGKRWDAIVLLDEADVVMSKRSTNELERNAIIAVWLGMLEYFEGILFLTTNRKDSLDDAFLSRIHLKIPLPELTDKQRIAIWENILQSNSQTTQDSPWTFEMFATLAKLNINGRVIKNLLRTAAYHSRSNDKPLSLIHLYEVIKVELSTHENIREVSCELESLLGTSK